MLSHAGRAEEWRGQGSYFSWAPKNSNASAVDIFHVEMGEEDAPTLVLVHGFPTCSIDWFAVVGLLRDGFRVCALDFPGYGFSDKPPGWGYSLARDAELLDYYVGDVLGASSIVMIGHDRGSSVAMNYVLTQANRAAEEATAPKIEHLVLTNGNIFLPLSNLTNFQRLVLDEATAQGVLENVTPSLLAAGMGVVTFSPPRVADDPDVEALAATFAHADGVKVLHETIQYLRERAENERDWLEGLRRLEVPTT